MLFSTLPIPAGEKAKEEQDVFTFDAKNIPSSLKSAKQLILTGEWGTADFAALTAAIGNNSGFPPAGNNTIEKVDMSQATIKSGTSLHVAYGIGSVGTFQGCKALKEFVMPTKSEAAHFTSFRAAFQNCNKLEAIDMTGCTNLTNLTDAFFGCTTLKICDLSSCSKVTSSESLFDHCEAMEKVKLPSKIVLQKYAFGSCLKLKQIDWEAYEGTQAPDFAKDLFQYITDFKAIRLIVPDAAYDSFAAHADWSKFTLVKASTAGIGNTPANQTLQPERPICHDRQQRKGFEQSAARRLHSSWPESDRQIRPSIAGSAAKKGAKNDVKGFHHSFVFGDKNPYLCIARRAYWCSPFFIS